MLNYCRSPSTRGGFANTQADAACASPAARRAVNPVVGPLLAGSKWHKLSLRRDVSESSQGRGPQNVRVHSFAYLFIHYIFTEDLIVQC